MMTYELDDIEKEALLNTVIDRARTLLNDGRPLTEMGDTIPMTEEAQELQRDASALAHTAIRFSGLYKELTGDEWDALADKLGALAVMTIQDEINAELTRREAESSAMDEWLASD